MNNNKEISFQVDLSPRCFGEAIKNYLVAQEVIGENTKVNRLVVPVMTNDDGDITIEVTVPST